MRNVISGIFLSGLIAFLLMPGCAGNKNSPHPRAIAGPATQPSSSIALIPFDKLDAPAEFPASATTVPASKAPLDALELYARARDARFRNQPYSAINLLEQAVKLDPYSFELQLLLASTYHAVGNLEQAMLAYERAAHLKPTDLILHAELGRAYMQKHDVARGIYHLRLARNTEDYRDDRTLAAAVDHRLAVALQQGGYDRAALDVYEDLLRKLQEPTSDMRTHAEVALLLQRPHLLLEQIARLYERTGQPEEALRRYRAIAQTTPDDFAAHARVVTALSNLNRHDEATRQAAQVVRQFRASVDSLTLLRATFSRAKREQALIEELRELRAQRPNDLVVLFALSDALSSSGQPTQAETLLAEAADQRGGDVEIVTRLARLLIEQGKLARCAEMLIESTARHPHTTAELDPLWNDLASTGKRKSLRITDLQSMQVAPQAEAARLYQLSRVAQAWNQAFVAEEALDRSLTARPLFPPAMRALAERIWAEPALDESIKARRSRELATVARDAGDEATARELEGLSLLAQNRPAEAVAALASALEFSGNDPSLLLSHAVAHRAAGEREKFEQRAWALISDHPHFAPVYPILFRHYLEKGAQNPARNTVETWLANMPQNPDARILQATIQLRLNQTSLAEQHFVRLFEDHPDRLDVLANLRAFYSQLQQPQKYIDLLEQRRAQEPYNYPLVAMLVDVYVSQQRLEDATRAIDATRSAVADDVERLYFVSHLYARVEQPQQIEQTLMQVLRLDPNFAPAANDLGYTWADAGKDLDRAESLVRRAVNVEPKNPMFLDSLGWVLYKRGQFSEARQHLEQAVANARPAADAVILDHLGDVLYRLDETPQAIRHWQLAQQRIAVDDQREQNKTLRLQLVQKLKQAEQQQPVSVAPTLAKFE